MDSRKVNSREFQRQAIDAEIKSLEESIRALRYRRNAVAPISSLPTEVIAVIFSISRLFNAPLSGGKQDHLAWLRVTHVCRHWREIALNNPLFWSHIDFDHLTLAGVTEVLVRAKKAPLQFSVWVTGYHRDHARFNALQKELQSHVTNIRDLEIAADAFFLRRTLKKLASPALNLESLSLSAEPNYQLKTPSRATIPDTLFGGIAPRLSFLELDKCKISWKSPLLKGLRYLDIHASSKHVTPSLSDWLDALDEMPQLQKLILVSASPIAPPFPSDIERTVTLPFLTHLEISSSVVGCALALSHLALPVLTQLSIEAKSVLLGGGDELKLLPYVARHSHGPQDTQPLRNVVIRGERKKMEIFAYPDTNVQSDPYLFSLAVANTPPRVALSVTCQYTTEILNAAMTALPLDNIQKLTVPDHTRVDEQFWHTHETRWRLLECVLLTPLAARGFREMVLQDNGGHENPLLPSLTSLTLIASTLTAPRTLRLRNALMKRVDQGVPLETLDLRSCYATNHAVYSVAVKFLSEIVVHVWARKPPYSGAFITDDSNDSGAEDYSDSDDESEPRSSDGDEGGDDEEIDDDDEEEDYEVTDGD